MLFWANNIKMTMEEEFFVKLLWKAGCKCTRPLLGFAVERGPRCRICNIEVNIDKISIHS